MQLSNRLAAVADMVTPGNIVADVGCDHGYLSIYLVEKGIVPNAIAMDVNKGPLEKAKEHIQEYAFSQYIEPRLSDGVKALAEGEADSLICAGMGGRLIIKILTESQSKTKSLKEIILQPQSEIWLVRKYLREIGYSIVDENMILEDEKFYSIIRAVVEPMEEHKKAEISTTKRFDKYGELLLEHKNQTLLKMLKLELIKYKSILFELENTAKKTEKQIVRSREIEAEMEEIEAALQYFKET